MEQQRPLLVLIDGHSLLYRAYHGLPNTLRARSGEPTNAVFGFTSMLLNVLKERKPAYAAVAMDVGRSFRNDDFEAYKAQRPETPNDFIPQVARAREILEALRIPVLTAQGYEADDVIGTIAERAKELGASVLIVTGDTDAFQLVDENVQVLTSGRRFSDTVVYDVRAIRERYGLEPRQLIDYKALVGDRSDNIRGVHGIGEKTATQLLRRFGSVESIYEHLAEVQPAKVQQALAAGKDDAFLSKHLVTIRRDVPLDFDLEQCRLGEADAPRLRELFRELGFRQLAERFDEVSETGQLKLFAPAEQEGTAQAVSEAEQVPQQASYRVLTDARELAAMAERIRNAGLVAIDVESDSLNAISAGIVGMSLSVREGEGYYIPIAHRQAGERNARMEDVKAALSTVLGDPSVLKIAHNAKFDWEILRRHGLGPSNPDFDTMIAEWVVNPASRGLSLKNLAWTRLGVEMTPITELIGSGKGQKCMADVAVERVAPYAAADADMTLRLWPILKRELAEREQTSLFADIEMPLVPVLADMELTGVKIDVGYLRQFSATLDKRLQEIVTRIQLLAGFPVNVNSTQQLSEFLFHQLGLPCAGLPRTASGHFSTSAEVLESLRGKHEVVDMILEQRQLSKLKSTYVDALPALVNPSTGRVHTSYNQTGTVTGRLSSSDPNLQNIPIRTELGREVRRAFIAEPGNILVGADYSQVELRILAHVSQDPALLKAFAEGQDIHASTAALTYGVSLSEVTPEQRRVAKTVNFAVLYGVSPYGLARQSDLSREEAEIFMRAYFRNYPRVQEYIERTKEEVRRKGYVETLLGRRRYFPELANGQRLSQSQRGESERAAINAPIQGTAADIIKIAMIRLHRELQARGFKSRMILQVHDELILEGPEAEAEAVAQLTKETMEGAFQLDAPLKVDLDIGHNWMEMK